VEVSTQSQLDMLSESRTLSDCLKSILLQVIMGHLNATYKLSLAISQKIMFHMHAEDVKDYYSYPRKTIKYNGKTYAY